jgi:hypothetical protein
MKKLIILFNILFLIGCGLNFEKDLKLADKLYQENKKEEAHQYYLKAAKKGSAEAHYNLAYRYVVDKEDAIYHYTEAAKLGHSDALHKVLELLFFRGNNLILANPKKALDIYKIAKSNNPELTFRNEQNDIEILKLASEVPLLDGKKLIEEYHLDQEPGFNTDDYFIWNLAEKASRGEFFTNPTPELVVQLIIKGGSVPAETAGAVKDYYAIWKNNNDLVEFNICNYVTSGQGLSYCAVRNEQHEIMKLEEDFLNLISNYDENLQELFANAYDSVSDFLDEKIWAEEGHDGSGYVMWAKDSLLNQKKEYLKLLEKVLKGYLPENKSSLVVNQKKLNNQYINLCNELMNNPHQIGRFFITDKDLKEVQDLWIKCKDLNIELFSKISKCNDKKYWENYFISKRIEQYDLFIEIKNGTSGTFIEK